MIRVLLVEDHPLLRAGARAELDAAADIVPVAATGDGGEALTLARDLRPDVVLLDPQPRGHAGSDVARALREELPAIKVLVLADAIQEQLVRHLFALGVHGYLLKSVSGAELRAAVRAVHRGEGAV